MYVYVPCALHMITHRRAGERAADCARDGDRVGKVAEQRRPLPRDGGLAREECLVFFGQFETFRKLIHSRRRADYSSRGGKGERSRVLAQLLWVDRGDSERHCEASADAAACLHRLMSMKTAQRFPSPPTYTMWVGMRVREKEGGGLSERH